MSLLSPALADQFFTARATWEAQVRGKTCKELFSGPRVKWGLFSIGNEGEVIWVTMVMEVINLVYLVLHSKEMNFISMFSFQCEPWQ